MGDDEKDRAAGDVFVVDDNARNLSLLEALLSERGYRVRVASNGDRAVKMARAHPPDLILLDILMPDLDGYAVCEVLKSDPVTASIPVIFISALDEPLDKVRAFGVGGVDYVTKPFNGQEVLARVGSQVRIARLQKEAEARTAELRKTNEQLRSAQEQIDRLSRPTAGRLENTPAWASAMAAEVAEAIGAREIGIWMIAGERLTRLSRGGTTPDLGLLRAAGGADVIGPDGSHVVPVVGPGGEPRGALVIDGPSAAWGETERRVLAGLAHHVGTALELRSLREQLTAAETSRATTRRALHERGVEMLLLCPRCGRCFPDPSPGTGGGVESVTCSADGVLLDGASVLPFRIGGRYRLTRRLGQGGMGIVFAGHDDTLSRDVALKIIRPHHLADPAMRFRFEREAKSIAAIQHPGVTVLYDSAEMEDGSVCLVMELLRGSDLAALLNGFGAGTPRQVARLVRHAGEALAAAHRAGVFHRDIKPENIFLVAEPGGFQTKLLDFGLARSTRLDTRLTLSGVIVGTPAYMAPEQARGLDTDERADVYSLASVAWEALVGHRMVTGNEAMEIMMNVMCDPAPPVSRFLPEISSAVDGLFEVALAKSPEARPKDVEEWAATLATLLEACDLEGRVGWPSQAWERGGVSDSIEAVRTLTGPSPCEGIDGVLSSH